MTQVNFYTLSSEDADSRIQFACRLVEKARTLEHQIFIQADTAEQARRLDDMLWQFKPGSFIAHALTQQTSPGDAVTISVRLEDATHNDMVINLSREALAGHLQFARINEIVGADKPSLEQGRQRYRFYSENGHTPLIHKL